MKRKKHHCLSRFQRLWAHAKKGGMLAIIPCVVTEDVLRACHALPGAELVGWVGFGSSQRGEEAFVVLSAPGNDPTSFSTYIHQTVHELGGVAVVAEGFELSLLTPIFNDGEPMAALRQPFGLSPRIEESPGEMTLSFDSPAPQPEPEPKDWMLDLQDAYADVHNHVAFLFQGHYE